MGEETQFQRRNAISDSTVVSLKVVIPMLGVCWLIANMLNGLNSRLDALTAETAALRKAVSSQVTDQDMALWASELARRNATLNVPSMRDLRGDTRGTTTGN